MSQNKASKVGQCRCGDIQFEVAPPILLTMACHCKGCQRMTGSAFSLSEMFAASSFNITKGEPVVGGMKQLPAHYVCPNCASWVFTRVSAPGSEFINVRASLFNEPANQPPFIETCTNEKLNWVHVGAAHSFDNFPPKEAFLGLVKQFMEQ
jgi:hypothetical protein